MQTSRIAAAKAGELLSDPASGIAQAANRLSEITGISIGDMGPITIVQQSAPAPMLEKAVSSRYPAIHLYPAKIQNTLREKFRDFSGQIQMTAEIRVSQDRIEDLEERLGIYTDAVIAVLDRNRGDWGQGMFFGGAYEVRYEGAQMGGRNYLQSSKILFEVDFSR